MLRTFLTLLAYWRRHRLQCAISVLGVALGVAVVTAMDLANASALASFRQSLRTVTGRTTHQIVPADGAPLNGVPEDLFARVAREPGVIAAAPVIESHGVLLAQSDAVLGGTPEEDRRSRDLLGAEHETSAVVRILGVDPLSEEPFRSFEGAQLHLGERAMEDWLLRGDGFVLAQPLAERLNLAVGAEVSLLSSGKRHKLRLIATFTSKDAISRGSDDVMLMDIAAAQEHFGQPEKISAIDLILPEGEAGAKAVAAVRALLPRGVDLQRPAQRAGRTEALLDAFQLNLTALSLLALVVGIFLVHNTLTVAVLQRISIIGTLRCLGVAGAQVRRAVLLEALLLGCVGSVLGLLGGRALAMLFLERVGGTVSDLYAHIGALKLFDDRVALLKGGLLGMVASVSGAYFPAREAGAVSPVQVLRRSRLELRAQSGWRKVFLAGAACFAVAAALSFTPGASPVPGLAAAFFLALGGALCSPGVTRWFSLRAGGLLARLFGPLGLLAARGIAANLSRTGLAVGALSLALSMTIGVALMISSFRSTLDRWMEQSLVADVYIRPAGPALLRHRAFMPLEIIEKLQARLDVEAVETYRGRDVTLADGSPVLVVATDTAVTFLRDRSRFPFLAGNAQSAYAGLLKGDVIISETLSRKRGLQVGDAIELPATSARREWNRLRVAAIYYEYATDRGVISMDRATYRRIFNDDRANSVALYLKPGINADAARDELRKEFGARDGLYIFSNRALRDEAFRVFDRTFEITGQLEGLSLAVGLCGILSALLALLRERSTDFALLRALGLAATGLSRLIVLEGMLLGAVAFLVACALGPALALLLIHVINVRAFGWTIFFSLHARVFLEVGALALLMSALAGLYPSWRARRMSIAGALREE